MDADDAVVVVGDDAVVAVEDERTYSTHSVGKTVAVVEMSDSLIVDSVAAVVGAFVAGVVPVAVAVPVV